MKGKTLAKLERIARNLPIVTPLTMVRSPCEHGEVYMAYGRDAEERFHGVWGINDVGQPVEFKPDATEKDVQSVLYGSAVWWASECAKRHMYDEGWWQSGRVR